MKQPVPHPIDLERRAITAYRRQFMSWRDEESHCHTLGDQICVVVTRLGAAVAVYAVKANGKLRKLIDLPEVIW